MNKQNFLFENPKSKGKKDFWQLVLIPIKLLPTLLVVIFVALIIVIFFIIGSIAPHYKTLQNIYSDGLSAQSSIISAKDFIKEKKFSEASAELAQAKGQFSHLREELNQLSRSPLFISGYLKDQYLVATNIVDIGVEASDAGESLVSIGSNLSSIFSKENANIGEMSSAEKQEILVKLFFSLSDLQSVNDKLSNINEKLIEINKHDPSFVFDKVLGPLQQDLPIARRTITNVIKLSKLMPMFAGFPEEKVFLLVLENNREMRPGGGFIGTYGLMKVNRGSLTDFFTDNSYNLDKTVEKELNIPTPEPMQKYMNVKKWFMRDANWYPDFPTSAEKVAWFYHAEGGIGNIDGVIGLTPTVIENLLGMIGEIKIGDLNFNKDNFWEQLEYHVEYGYSKKGIEYEERKNVIAPLGKEIFARIYNLPMDQILTLVDLLQREIEEKQLFVYSNDADFQKTIIENGWGAEVKDFEGDYLMLVDANLAALKTDEVMSRTLKYDLQEDKDGNLLAQTEVDYQHLGDFSWKTTRYRTFARLYVPENSELLEVRINDKVIERKDITVENEFNKTAFGIFLEVEPKTMKTVTWKYKLPEKISEQIKKGNYSLLVQKQPGIVSMNLQLNYNFSHEVLRDNLGYKADKNSVKHVDVLRKDQIYTIWVK